LHIMMALFFLFLISAYALDEYPTGLCPDKETLPFVCRNYRASTNPFYTAFYHNVVAFQASILERPVPNDKGLYNLTVKVTEIYKDREYERDKDGKWHPVGEKVQIDIADIAYVEVSCGNPVEIFNKSGLILLFGNMTEYLVFWADPCPQIDYNVAINSTCKKQWLEEEMWSICDEEAQEGLSTVQVSLATVCLTLLVGSLIAIFFVWFFRERNEN